MNLLGRSESIPEVAKKSKRTNVYNNLLAGPAAPGDKQYKEKELLLKLMNNKRKI